MAKRPLKFTITSKQQMRALVPTARQEIMDVLPGMGTVAISEVAAVLQRPADSLYYHFRILKRVRLLFAAGERRINGRREALFRAVAPEISLRYELGKKDNVDAVDAIVTSMLRLGIRNFGGSLNRSKTVVSGPCRELWALRKTGWLSKDQLSTVNGYIEKIIQVMSRTQTEGSLYGVTIVLNPLHRQGGN